MEKKKRRKIFGGGFSRRCTGGVMRFCRAMPEESGESRVPGVRYGVEARVDAGAVKKEGEQVLQ